MSHGVGFISWSRPIIEGSWGWRGCNDGDNVSWRIIIIIKKKQDPEARLLYYWILCFLYILTWNNNCDIIAFYCSFPAAVTASSLVSGKTEDTSTLKENRNCIFFLFIYVKYSWEKIYNPGRRWRDSWALKCTWKKSNRRRVNPSPPIGWLIYPRCSAQNPILGNGARLSEMLNHSVKKADIF